MNKNTIENFWNIYQTELMGFVNSTTLTSNDYTLKYVNWKGKFYYWDMNSTNMTVSLYDMYFALYEFIAIKQNEKLDIAKYINPSFEHLTSEKASISIAETAKNILIDSEAIIGNILNFHFEFPTPDQDSKHKFADNNDLFNALVGPKNPVYLLRLMRNNVHPECQEDQSWKPKRLSDDSGNLMQVLRFAVFTFLFVVALCRKSINYRKSQECPKLCEGEYKERYEKVFEKYFEKKADSVLKKFTPGSYTATFLLQKEAKDALSVQWSVGERKNNVDGNELKEPIKIENLHRYETVVLDVILEDKTKKNITIDLGNLSSGVTYNVHYEDGCYTESRRVEAESRNKDIIAYIYDKYEHGRTVTHQKYVCHFSLCSVYLDRGDNNIVNIAWNVRVIFKENVKTFDIGQITTPGNDIELIRDGFAINEIIASIEFDSEEIRHDMLWEDDRHSDYFSDTITELDLRAYSGKTIRMGKRFTNLKRLYLGKGDVVSAESFRDCTKLKTVVVKGEGEYTIGDMAFYGCSSLKSIVVPQEFENEAFAGCTALKDVSFPKGLKRIGNQAFEGCRSLKAIDMPDGLEEIGQGAFRHAGLEKILFPASVKKIRESAFYGCSSLEELCFPNGCGVEEMHDKAFMDCPNLKKIVIRDKEVTIQEYIDNYKPSVFEDVFDSSYSYEIFGPNKPNNFTRWLDAFMKNLEKTFEDL